MPFADLEFQCNGEFSSSSKPIPFQTSFPMKKSTDSKPADQKAPEPRSDNQPAHRIRYGSLSASIWRQETDKGAMFNVTFQRSYREGETWKTSASFGKHDLLIISLMATRAFEWIAAQSHGVEAEMNRGS